jgi:hypothetical protein
MTSNGGSNWSREGFPGTLEAHLWKLIWKLLLFYCCPIETGWEYLATKTYANTTFNAYSYVYIYSFRCENMY